ncbi:MAG: 16S rRNA (guanine(527)-N(7))-methyltransferase RsmG [Epsilonproteobacteria bacterium]|nr:16S rRNA (guanine(527)-N(7))-methyltransferase RsmG [Campylobacterota bacterium]NPA64895.1 16S rRNA (guanine(527)-N(7))-methyltransferase RsmG [Campylobacterota bacterium]
MSFDTFTQKLLEWNRIHNLTGAKTKEEIEKNIQDSLQPLKFLEGDFQRAIDIGTGAGFPGLILAMQMPKTHWYLIEPRKKRASFLNYIKAVENLSNVEVIPKRIEEIAPFKADLITSRAVMKTKDLLSLAKPFIGKDTTLLFYKGANVQEEVHDIPHRIINDGKRNYLIIKGEDVV